MLLFSTKCESQRRLDLSGYELAWYDEFDYATVGALWASGKWENGVPGADALPYSWTNPPEAYKFEMQNVTVNNGFLELKAEKCTGLNCPDVQIDGATYSVATTGGSIRSTYRDYICQNDLYATTIKGFNYGIFEIRAKLPKKQDDYATFWLWGPYWQCQNEHDLFSCEDLNLPPNDPAVFDCQEAHCPGFEIDVFEAFQQPDPNYQSSPWFRYFATVQANNMPNQEAADQCAPCPTFYDWKNSDPGKTYHTYTVAWTPEEITWFLDGTEIRTQRHAVPKFLLQLCLSMNKGNPDPRDEDSEPFSIDYIRVYRPTAANLSYNQLTPIHFWGVGNPFLGNALFTTNNLVIDPNDPTNLIPEDPKYGAYLDAWANTPCISEHNYQFKEANEFPVNNYITSSALQNIKNDPNLILYITTGDGFIKQTQWAPVINELKLSGKLFGEYRINNYWLPKLVDNVAGTFNAMSVSYSTGTLFFKGNDNRLWSRWFDGTTWKVSLVGTGVEPADVDRDVVVVDGDEMPDLQMALHPSRVYYVNTSNVLCYFEWCVSQVKWNRHTTNINNVQGSLVAAEYPWGKLYYIGTDNNVWNVYLYKDLYCTCNTTTANFATAYLGIYGDAHILANIFGGLAVSPDGERVYYTSVTFGWPFTITNRRIVYFQNNGNGWTRHLTNANDVLGPYLAVKKLPLPLDGDEVFYLSEDRNIGNEELKIKTLYQRKLNGIWPAVGNLNPNFEEEVVCTLDNLTANHGGNHFVLPHFYVEGWMQVTSTEPRKVFAKATTGVLGYYDRTNAEPLCPGLFEGCNRNRGLENGLEFRASPPPPKNLVVWPNPTEQVLNIGLPDGIGCSLIEVFNITGQIVLSQDVSSNGIVILDVSALPRGVYQVVVEMVNGKSEAAKFLVL